MAAAEPEVAVAKDREGDAGVVVELRSLDEVAAAQVVRE